VRTGSGSYSWAMATAACSAAAGSVLFVLLLTAARRARVPRTAERLQTVRT
jgi:hypothetical protein